MEEAVAKLKAMNRPVPTPTDAAMAQNKAEEASRGQNTRMTTIMGNFKKGPDMAHAAKVGEPTMEDPKQTSAPEIVKNVMQMAVDASTETSKATVETVKPGAKANESVPRSDTATPAPATGDAAAPPPTQVNDAKDSTSTPPADTAKSTTDKKAESTSKPKKKKGLRKIIPF